MKSIDASPDAITILTACPLCGERNWFPVSTPSRWIGLGVFGDLSSHLGLVACRECGLVFTNPRPSDARLKGFYSGDNYTCHETIGSASAGAKAAYLLTEIQKAFPPQSPRNLLDYGAGGGGFLLHAREQGWQVRGFEPGRRGLEACRAAGLEVTDRLEDLPPRHFSLITLHHVFEHLAQPLETLATLGNLLAPGGLLFVEVPNTGSLRARLAIPLATRRFPIDERYRAFPIHLMYYDHRTLRRMLTKGGWRVNRVFTVGLGMEEFFIRTKKPLSCAASVSSGKAARPALRGRKKLRHLARDAFLRLGLGENVAVIASLSNCSSTCNQ